MANRQSKRSMRVITGRAGDPPARSIQTAALTKRIMSGLDNFETNLIEEFQAKLPAPLAR